MELSEDNRLRSVQNVDPADIYVKREINRSETSSVYEIELRGATYVMKLVSAIGLSSLNNDNKVVPR
jgi:hypothetical protein